MNTIALLLVSAGFCSVAVAWGSYFATIPKGTVPARPTGTITLQLGGAGLAIAGLLWSTQKGISPGVLLVVPAVLTLVMALFFLFLLSQRRTPVGDIKVAVGDTLLPFETQDSDGEPWHTDSLAGKRTLLKFFRGGW